MLYAALLIKYNFNLSRKERHALFFLVHFFPPMLKLPVYQPTDCCVSVCTFYTLLLKIERTLVLEQSCQDPCLTMIKIMWSFSRGVPPTSMNQILNKKINKYKYIYKYLLRNLRKISSQNCWSFVYFDIVKTLIELVYFLFHTTAPMLAAALHFLSIVTCGAH